MRRRRGQGQSVPRRGWLPNRSEPCRARTTAKAIEGCSREGWESHPGDQGDEPRIAVETLEAWIRADVDERRILLAIGGFERVERLTGAALGGVDERGVVRGHVPLGRVLLNLRQR